MDSLFAFIEKLIEEFSWKRFLFVISIICTLMVGIIIFESYTGNFRLARIEKSVDIIAKLNALPPDISNESKNILSSAIKGVSNDINIFTNGNSTPFSIHKDFLKVIAAFAPWFLFSILMLSGGVNGTKAALMGAIVFAIPGAVIGYYLPSFEK